MEFGRCAYRHDRMHKHIDTYRPDSGTATTIPAMDAYRMSCACTHRRIHAQLQELVETIWQLWRSYRNPGFSLRL